MNDREEAFWNDLEQQSAEIDTPEAIGGWIGGISCTPRAMPTFTGNRASRRAQEARWRKGDRS